MYIFTMTTNTQNFQLVQDHLILISDFAFGGLLINGFQICVGNPAFVVVACGNKIFVVRKKIWESVNSSWNVMKIPGNVTWYYTLYEFLSKI